MAALRSFSEGDLVRFINGFEVGWVYEIRSIDEHGIRLSHKIGLYQSDRFELVSDDDCTNTDELKRIAYTMADLLRLALMYLDDDSYRPQDDEYYLRVWEAIKKLEKDFGYKS